jgi:hypothetical protein
MANNQLLTHVPEPVDYEAAYSYPATSYIFPMQGSAGVVHLIWYAGAPSTLFDSAPNGSVLTDTTNGDTWVKTLAVGSGANGTWTQT